MRTHQKWVVIDPVETGFLAPDCSARPFLGSRRIETASRRFLDGRHSTGKQAGLRLTREAAGSG
jgi:hypothetical protein